MSEVTELDKSIVAALRNPDNSDRMILTSVKLGDIETSAVCWVGEENGRTQVQPMVLVINPEIFAQIKLNK